MTEARPVKARMIVRVLFVLILYAAVEAISLTGLWVLRKYRGIGYFPEASRLAPKAISGLDSFLQNPTGGQLILDAELGWKRHRRNEVNPAGMRDDLDYQLEPAPGILRLSAFGDSFTYGSDVPLGENWSKRISALAPQIEVLNYGMGGYGLDQAYLRYSRDGREYNPHIVLIGYMTENIARNVNVYRAFYTSSYRDFFFSKPRFVIHGDTLALLPNPLRTIDDYRNLRANYREVLPSLGRNDHHFADAYAAGPFDFSPTVRLAKIVLSRLRAKSTVPVLTRNGEYNTESEAYAITLKLFDNYYRQVLDDGALPVIVVFPDTNDQQRSRNGQARRYEPLLEVFRQRGYRYVDLMVPFEQVESKHTMANLTVKWGHFSKLGNDLAARYILHQLDQMGLTDAARVDSLRTLEMERLGGR